MISLRSVLLSILAAIIVWLIVLYNRLVSFRTRVEEAWSDIDVQLKRRYDLIPNLIQTVKGYASHESALFEKVTEARTKAMGAQSVAEHGNAENMLSQTLKSLFAVSEAYPDLKASTNFLQLQDEISDTENKIQASRRFYNGNVRDYNILLLAFPSNLIANLFHFESKEFFEIEEAGEKENVKVKF
jgi:LemA protein